MMRTILLAVLAMSLTLSTVGCEAMKKVDEADINRLIVKNEKAVAAGAAWITQTSLASMSDKDEAVAIATKINTISSTVYNTLSQDATVEREQVVALVGDLIKEVSDNEVQQAMTTEIVVASLNLVESHIDLYFADYGDDTRTKAVHALIRGAAAGARDGSARFLKSPKLSRNLIDESAGSDTPAN